MKRPVLLPAALALLVIACICGCGGSNQAKDISKSSSPAQTAPEPDTSKAESPEHKLAILEKGFYVKPDSTTVSEVAAILENLQAKFPDNSREEIAETIIETRDEIIEKGKSISILQVARGIDGCVPISEKGEWSLRQASRVCVNILSSE